MRLEEEIGLSRGAIFNWFPSKEELFIALAARDNERLLLLFAEEGLEGILDALLRDDPGLARRLPRVRAPAAGRCGPPQALGDDRARAGARPEPRVDRGGPGREPPALGRLGRARSASSSA